MNVYLPAQILDVDLVDGRACPRVSFCPWHFLDDLRRAVGRFSVGDTLGRTVHVLPPPWPLSPDGQALVAQLVPFPSPGAPPA